MYSFASGTILSAGTCSPSKPGTQPVSSNISLASFRRAIHSLGIALLMVRRRAAKLKPALFALADSQPEKSEATSDDEGYPAYRLRHRPVADDEVPLRKNPYQVEQRHHGED